MLQRLVPKYKWNKATEPEKYGTGLVGFLKNLYGEAPEVCLAAFVGGLGVARVVYLYCTEKDSGYFDNRPYKLYYTVMRPDDPRIGRLRADWYENGVPPMTTTRLG